jgi:hypothetical protein
VVETVTPPTADSVFAGAAALEEDWFGEGSAFSSGEELASALMALVGSRAAPAAAVPPPPPPAMPFVDAPRSRAAALAEPVDEFQVASMPSFQGRGDALPAEQRQRASGWRQAPAPTSPQRTGWSIRQGVQILRLTEETIVRLREEAAERTWALVAAAYRDTDA